ncbi:carbohydrate kinase family protein [Tepidanaerobacter syntrophicus]|uniref:carbohydrate kinase family protein n=1 Tax=Tepidanaerobacter syntrophicus TaxID=224999 RepID=UPI001BD33F97|nr:PfkB family carbohydrate kinase [Tepidanaerobacter syntrophicus]
MKFDAVISGYISMDRIIKVASPLRAGRTSIIINSDSEKIYYGGCSTNIAYILGKMGLKPLPIIRVGEDNKANDFLRYLKSANIELDAVEIIKGEISSYSYIVSDKDDNHVTMFYPGAMDSRYSKKIDDKLIKNSRIGILTVGSYLDSLEFYNKCLKHDIPLVFGAKLDYDAFPIDFLKKILLKSKIIFSNKSEAEDIQSIFNIDDMAKLFSLGNAEIMIVTLGEEGSLCYEKTSSSFKLHKIKPYKLEKVVDATGAGDAYIGGFLYGYLNGKSVIDCCLMGSVMSSFVLEKVGCTTNIPTSKQFYNRLNEYINFYNSY